MENMSEQEQKIVDQVYNRAAQLMIHQKKDMFEVKRILVDDGLDEASALAVVTNLDDQITKAKKETAKKDMLYGALWCVGGTIVTFISYSSASGGGSYVITWGAILFGGIQFFRGLVNSADGD
jgi:hypothetical protein